MKDVQPVQWIGGVDGCLRLIDQTRLPVEFVEIDCRECESVWEAIKTLRVRGAPAMASQRPTACVWVCKAFAAHDQGAFFRQLHAAAAYLATSRPTAVNLFLGPGADETRRPSDPQCVTRRNHRGPAGRSPHHPRRRPADVPGHGPLRSGAAPRRPGRVDALQCGRFGDLGLRHRAGRAVCRHRGGQAAARLRR